MLAITILPRATATFAHGVIQLDQHELYTMKHLFTLLLCIATFNSQAQLQNGGFEDLNYETLPYYWK